MTDNPGAGLSNHLYECIERALDIRQPLITDVGVDAFRVFNGRPDGIAGLAIEKLGDVLIVQLHAERLHLEEAEVRSLVEYAHGRLRTRAVYKKVFVRDRSQVPADVSEMHRSAKPWIGEAVEADLVIKEGPLRFIIRPYDGFSVGLFLEHRDNRRRIVDLAGGKRVLNGFCYTCGFSVSAVAGGAASVDSVDISKHYLEWGKQNFAVNGIDLSVPHPFLTGRMGHPPCGYWFFCSDVFDFYKRAQRQGRSYDLIVLDPPTFSRSRRPKRVFELSKQLDKLVAGAVELLEPGGLIFLATNCREISRQRMEEACMATRGPRECTIVEQPQLPIDFAGDPEYSKSIIVRYR
ncbi:MAG: class I SAM-dependent rRNA methyltransferase [Planctomycetota bacterium]|jgi:23S rRNA (cytosine1962-C5)-methyltransferase